MIILLLLLCTNITLDATHFILIGPPGSGKGTFSSYMVENHNYVHICPGDIIRTEVKNETELGNTIKPIVERGEYVQDSIIYAIIENAVIKTVAQEQLFIIDGFPRNEAGLQFLVDLFEKLNISQSTQIIHFIAKDDTCVERIINRMVCFSCHRIYNGITKKSLSIENRCEVCNNQLEMRIGDTEENTRKRLKTYHATIEPLAELAAQFFPCTKLNTDISLSLCSELYTKTLCI